MGALISCSSREPCVQVLPGEPNWIEFYGLVDRELDTIFQDLDEDKKDKLDRIKIEGMKAKLAAKGYKTCPEFKDFDFLSKGGIDSEEFHVAYHVTLGSCREALLEFVANSAEYKEISRKEFNRAGADANEQATINAQQFQALAADVNQLQILLNKVADKEIDELMGRHKLSTESSIKQEQFDALLADFFCSQEFPVFLRTEERKIADFEPKTPRWKPTLNDGDEVSTAEKAAAENKAAEENTAATKAVTEKAAAEAAAEKAAAEKAAAEKAAADKGAAEKAAADKEAAGKAAADKGAAEKAAAEKVTAA